MPVADAGERAPAAVDHAMILSDNRHEQGLFMLMAGVPGLDPIHMKNSATSANSIAVACAFAGKAASRDFFRWYCGKFGSIGKTASQAGASHGNLYARINFLVDTVN